MGDTGDEFRFWRGLKKDARAKYGLTCPQCKVKRPKASPSILLPGQRCRVDGFRDPRPLIIEGV